MNQSRLSGLRAVTESELVLCGAQRYEHSYFYASIAIRFSPGSSNPRQSLEGLSLFVALALGCER